MRRLQYLLVLIFINQTFANAEESERSDAKLRRLEVKEYCHENVSDPRCNKLLDGEYRKLKDAEKITREEIKEKYQEEKYSKDKSNELKSFCRKYKDAPRCLKSGL